MREKIKLEAVAPALRQLAGQEEEPGESTVDSLRYKDVWGPQEGESGAMIKTAYADCLGSSVGYGLQEKLGLWEEGSPGEAGTSQLWRHGHRSRPGAGASKEQDCRERQSHSHCLGRPAPSLHGRKPGSSSAGRRTSSEKRERKGSIFPAMTLAVRRGKGQMLKEVHSFDHFLGP